MWRFLKLIQLWINFSFLHMMIHVQKFEISPHGRFFLHGPGPWAGDKYQVWAMTVMAMTVTKTSDPRAGRVHHHMWILPHCNWNIHKVAKEWRFCQNKGSITIAPFNLSTPSNTSESVSQWNSNGQLINPCGQNNYLVRVNVVLRGSREHPVSLWIVHEKLPRERDRKEASE